VGPALAHLAPDEIVKEHDRGQKAPARITGWLVRAGHQHVVRQVELTTACGDALVGESSGFYGMSEVVPNLADQVEVPMSSGAYQPQQQDEIDLRCELAASSSRA